MNLRNLAADIHGAVLILLRVEFGRDPIREHAVRVIAATLNHRSAAGVLCMLSG
jgi:hypothetical protein